MWNIDEKSSPYSFITLHEVVYYFFQFEKKSYHSVGFSVKYDSNA